MAKAVYYINGIEERADGFHANLVVLAPGGKLKQCSILLSSTATLTDAKIADETRTKAKTIAESLTGQTLVAGDIVMAASQLNESLFITPSRLGSGTADSTTFLRGDQAWAVPAGGSSSYQLFLDFGTREVAFV